MERNRLPELISDLYRIVGELEAMFPGRHFTPDGHLVGSLGECLAAYHYGLDLLPASTTGVDAVKDGRNIEIKATQRQRVALRSEPQHLLVFHLNREGGFSEVYNGPGDIVWREFQGRTMPSNGQFQISLSRLTWLMQEVASELRLPMKIPNKSLQPALGRNAPSRGRARRKGQKIYE